MYILSIGKIVIFSLLMGLVCGLSCIAYFEYTRFRELPVVAFENGTCMRVVNFKNGDAYNCNDVNVLLRRFRTETKGIK